MPTWQPVAPSITTLAAPRRTARRSHRLRPARRPRRIRSTRLPHRLLDNSKAPTSFTQPNTPGASAPQQPRSIYLSIFH